MVSYDDEFEREYRRLEALNEDERRRRLAELEGTDPNRAEILRRMLEPEQTPTEEVRERLFRGILSITAPNEIAGFYDFVPIAQGGQGSVFRARRRGSSESFAVKLFPLTDSEQLGEPYLRFRREANLLRSLNDPHVVAYVADGVESIDGRLWHYIAMELVDPAIDVLSFVQNIPFDLGVRIELIAKMCEAVEPIHSAGIVHRDLKPRNILVGAGDRIRLIDFGIAQKAIDDDGRTQVTLTGNVVGTPQYMSPEQANPEGAKFDARTDVYSLGAIAYQILCDEPPIRCPGVVGRELFERISKTDPKPLHRVDPRIPVAIAHVIDTALRKEPGLRYPTAREFAIQLRKAFAGEDYEARPLSSVRRVARWLAKHRAATAAVVFALLALISEFKSHRQRLAAATTSAFLNARGLMSIGDWSEARLIVNQAVEFDEVDPTDYKFALIDILQGQNKFGEARAIIGELEARTSDMNPIQFAHYLLLAGDHSGEPSLMADPNRGREMVVEALETGALSGSEAAYARAILSPSPIEQSDLLHLAIRLDPKNWRAFAMLVPTLLFSGRATEAKLVSFRFRGSFPRSPDSALAELTVRCLVDDEKLGDLRAQYPEIPEVAISELEWLLRFRESFGAYFRGIARAGMVNDADPARAKRIVAEMQALALDELLKLGFTSKDGSAEALSRMPPSLAVSWGKTAKNVAFGMISRLGAKANAKALDECMLQNREAALRVLRGMLATNMGNDAECARFFLEAAELAPDSLFLVEPASSLIGLGVTAKLKDRSDLAGLERTLRTVLARDDLEGDEFSYLADIASGFLNKGNLTREIVFRWISTRPKDLEAYLKVAWVERSEGNHASAIRYTRVALDLDPKNTHALRVLEELEKEKVEAGKGK